MAQVRVGGMLSHHNNANALNGKLFEHNDIEFSEYLPELYRVLKPNTHCYLMINALNLKDLQQAAEDAGFRMQNILVWKKNTSTPNQYYMQCLEFILMLRKGAAKRVNDCGICNCLSVPNIIGKGKKHHPTAKPVELMRIMIEQSSNKGDVVLDPFAGGGSTLVAAKQAERNYIGFEIDPKYYEMANKRLYQEPMQAQLF
jgi:site-specific DNA-methyltransferase (adenine-specific)